MSSVLFQPEENDDMMHVFALSQIYTNFIKFPFVDLYVQACFVHCECNRVQVPGCLIGHVAWQHYDGFQSGKANRCLRILREVLTNQSYHEF